MMKRIILTAFCIFNIAIVNAQTFSWAKSLGSGSNEEGRSVVVDAGGNVYTTGYLTGSGDFDPGPGVVTLTSAGSSDVYISKLDASGNFVWAIRMGGTGPQSATAIALDNSGNIYLTGNFNNTIDLDPGAGFAGFTSLGAQDVFIAKYDPAGNYVWSKRFGSASHEAATDIAIDGSGNVITCGQFTATTDFDPGAGTASLTPVTTYDAYISKLDLNGNYVWAKQIGLNGNNAPTSLTTDAAGNIYMCGYYEGTTDFDPGAAAYPITSAGMQDIFFVKLDASGAFSWAGSMGGTVADYGRSVAIDANGDVLITGEFQGTADLDPTVGIYNLTATAVKDIFVAKFNPATASFIWAVRIGDTNNEIGYGITTDASNNIYVTGDFIGTVDFDPGAGSVLLSSNGGQRDCFILKLDASGNYMWAGGFGSASLGDDAFSIYVDASTNIYTTGYYQDVVDFDPGAGISTLTAGGQLDVFVLKIQQCSPPLAPTNTTSAASLTLCGTASSTTLTASGSGTLGWYSASTGGSYLGGGTSFTTPVLSNTTTYYVQDSTCAEGTRTAITVTFSPAMSTSVSSQTNVTCNGDNDGAAGVSVSGGTPNYTYLWAPSGGTSPAEFNLTAGTYICTVTDAAGCVQAQMIFITEPAAIDLTTTVGGNTISANQSGATYQWIDCFNNTPVVGETSQLFAPVINGDYAVIVTVGACSDTSACASFTTGIETNESAAFKVFPNPTNGIVNIQLTNANGSLEIFNATGQLVSTIQITSTNMLIELPEAAGIYLVRLNSNGKTSNVRVIKE